MQTAYPMDSNGLFSKIILKIQSTLHTLTSVTQKTKLKQMIYLKKITETINKAHELAAPMKNPGQ